MVQLDVKYSVTFNANGGSGGPSNISGTMYDVEFGSTFTVGWSGSPSRSGYTFLGWATSASATSASYSTSYTFTANNQSVNVNLYAVWEPRTYAVSYNKGANGTGTNASDTKTHGINLTLRRAIFTRTGFNQIGWSVTDGGAKTYELGGTYSANASVTLYPTWKATKSTFTVPSSVPADGSTTATVTITRYSTSYAHRVVVALGEHTQTFNGVATSVSFTIPTSWLSEIPTSTSKTGTVTVATFDGSDYIGSNVQSITITVPSSVKPTVSLTGTNQSSNNTVNSWDTLVQGYSTIKLTATASAGTGASVTSIVISGDGVSQSGTGTTATSDLLTTAGSKTWKVVVTDSRGRKNQATLTRTVFEYFQPWIAISAFRSDSFGTEAPSDGTYITATPRYGYASCDGHNTPSVQKLEYKLKTASTWTTAQNPTVSGTAYTFGTVSPLSEYNLRATVTDALGNTARIITNVPSVEGYAFGLNGKCVHFGGPIRVDDAFECDFRTLIHDDLTVDGRIYAAGSMQSGTVSVRSVASGNSATVSVTFDHAFSQIPTVVAGLYGSQTVGIGDCSASVWDVTTTGFSMRLINNYSSSRDIGATWIAIL